MTDPRRDEYRAECAAAARRGVIRLKWPKVYSLFLSNLNDNVNEQLLREELLPCGPLSLIKIPTLHGRSLGLARVELQPGVRPDRFIKHFHGRELLGQRMSVIVDQGASKFEEAVNNAKAPKNMDKSKEVPQPSPKKQGRTTDSPKFSPASPARLISDSDGPSPSKPKRPRCSSPPPSPKRHEGNSRSAGRNPDGSRSHRDPQFFQHRRGSYRGHEPAPRTHPRSFVANSGPRNYRERYQEDHDRYDNRTSLHNRNRFHPGGSRPHRYESFTEYPSHPLLHRGRHHGHHRNDRRDTNGYMDWYRSPAPRGFGHNHDIPDRHDNHSASGRSNFTHQRIPHHKKIGEPVWMDDIRPALTVKHVPRGTMPDDLFATFRDFRPKNAINNGYGNWTVWFDNVDVRNSAASIRYFRVRHISVEVVPSCHVVGRKSTYDAAPNSSRRYEGLPRNFDTRNQSGTERPVANGFGPAEHQNREERIARRNGMYEDDRKNPHLEHGSSRQSSAYRAVDNRFRSRTEPRHHAPNTTDRSPGRRISTEERDQRYSTKGGCYEEGNRAHGKLLSNRREHDELRRSDLCKQQEKPKSSDSPSPHFGKNCDSSEVPRDGRAHARNASRDMVTRDVRTKSRTDRDELSRTKVDDHETTGEGDIKMTSLADKRCSAKEVYADSLSNGSSKKIGKLSQDSTEVLHKVIPVETPKKLSAKGFAHILARHVYRTAKEAIAIRGSAVHKSLVVQSVAKLLKSRRDRENREKERAKQATLAKQKADTSDNGVVLSSTPKTAHLDLIETFLKPKPKQTKPPLPGRQSEAPSKKRVRKSRFSDGRATESEQDVKPRNSVPEDEEPNSPEIQRVKRRRLVLTGSPGSPDAEPASPDGNRQNSVESVASSELFREKDLTHGRKGDEGDESRKLEESVAPHNAMLHIEKPQVRHAKASSLKLSSPSTGEGSIPHLVLSLRPPPSPARSGPVGSAFTTSEDSMSHAPPKPSGVTKKITSRKAKTSAKTKKRSRGQARSSKKPAESTTDDEQYAGVLLSLNEKIKKPRSAHMAHVELINESGFFDCNLEEYCERAEEVCAEKIKDSQKIAEDKRDDPDECEPPERVGKCARTDMYVRADHVRQHRQRNVHARTSTSTQSSRECRQENRVYRKGVSQINPKNDIISLNHLKQRRKKVSFGQSRIHGMGLYAKEDIESGEFIIEYVGDLIRRVVADLREKKYARQGMGDSYLFRLSGDWVIDATRRGGIARYINHSCEPNVIARIISVDGEPKIVFYSKRSIKEGEELTYDYKFDYESEDKKIPCLCQAPSCRKYLN